jgi:hypothetical protein
MRTYAMLLVCRRYLDEHPELLRSTCDVGWPSRRRDRAKSAPHRPLNANQVSLSGDAKSSLGDAESSLGDAKSSLGDAESSLGGAKSSLGDAKSSLGGV